MINKIFLIGRVGKDPEARTIDNGQKVCNFSLATSENYTDKNGQNVEQAEWHSIVIWGKLVDVVEKYVKKGNLLYLEGKNKTRSWEKEGQTHYTTEVVCNHMKMLGGNKNDDHLGF